MPICIHCGHKNREGSLICDECHKSIDARVNRDETQMVNPFQAIPEWPQSLPAAPEPGISLIIKMPQGMRAIRLPHDRTLVLGRIDRDTLERPDIDLAAFCAMEYGVSRSHAVIDCTQEAYTLTDLDSRNGTYLNGRQLAPQQAYLLRHGDEIRLGGLAMHFYVQPVGE